MTDRELGRMHIENEIVRFLEATLLPEDRTAVEAWDARAQGICVADTLNDADRLVEWVGKMEDRTIAYGMLERLKPYSVGATVIVDPAFRGLGIGRMMGRLSTDLAIRNRQRVVLINAGTDPAARSIAADEDFEDVPDSPGQMRKELKWQ